MSERYWIKPNGDVLEAPEGHLRYIKENWQAQDLPADISLSDLTQHGWIRVSGRDVIIEHIDNPNVFKVLKDILIAIGRAQYTVWINNRPYTISLENITENTFDNIYREILAGKLQPVFADAYDQGLFETQPSWNETESDGSTGSKEQGISYLPQDWTKEVWWSRDLLDYLKKTFPGKKDVIPPEPDNGYPTQAWQVVDRMKKRADRIPDKPIVPMHIRYDLRPGKVYGVDYTLDGENNLRVSLLYYWNEEGLRIQVVKYNSFDRQVTNQEVLFFTDPIVITDRSRINESLDTAYDVFIMAINKYEKSKSPDEMKEWEERWGSLHKTAWYPKSFFKDPENPAIEFADMEGLMSVENHHLTPEGLIAKMTEWDEAEHGVPSSIYDATQRELEQAGYHMPTWIRREANPFLVEEKKFKIGDKVKLIIDDKYFADFDEPDMTDEIPQGSIGEIIDMGETEELGSGQMVNHYVVKFADGTIDIYDDDIELLDESQNEIKEWEERWGSLHKKALWSVWDEQTGQYMATGADSPTLQDAVEDCFQYLVSGPDFEEMTDEEADAMTWQQKKRFCEEYEFRFDQHQEPVGGYADAGEMAEDESEHILEGDEVIVPAGEYNTVEWIPETSKWKKDPMIYVNPQESTGWVENWEIPDEPMSTIHYYIRMDEAGETIIEVLGDIEKAHSPRQKGEPKEKDTEMKEWEERWGWGKTRGLNKQAWGAPTIRKEDIEWVLSGESRYGHRNRGNVTFTLHDDGLFTVRFYATDVVVADTNTNEIQSVTTGGWHNSSTTGVIHQVLRILHDEYGYDYPKMKPDYEYNSRVPLVWSDKELAEDSDTTPEKLAELAKNKDSDVRARVAVHSNTPPEVLAELAHDDNYLVVRRVIDNYKVPKKVIKELAKSDNPGTRAYVAISGHCPDDLFRKLMGDPDPKVRATIARNKGGGRWRGDAEIAKYYLNDESDIVRATVAQTGRIDENDIKKLMKDPSEKVRVGLAKRDNIDSKLFAQLVKDPSRKVRIAVAERTRDDAILTLLAKDKDETVREAVAEKDWLDQETMNILAEDKEPYVRWLVLQNRRADEQIYIKLYKDPASPNREYVATRIEDPQCLRELARDRSEQVRLNVAKNYNTPAEALAILAEDKNEVIRQSVLQHCNVTPEILLQLGKDVNPKVRQEIARRTNSEQVLEGLSRDESPEVRYAVAQSEYVTPEILELLSRDTSNVVRSEVTKHSKTSEAVLLALTRDSDEKVRLSLIENYVVRQSIPILLRLSRDTNAEIAEDAKQRLDRLGYKGPSEEMREWEERWGSLGKKAGAICEYCHRDMMATDTCDYPWVKINNAWYERVLNDVGTCHDCNVGMDKLHHPGCDAERCPKCHGQMISCGCNPTELSNVEPEISWKDKDNKDIKEWEERWGVIDRLVITGDML